jgi:hypothetical protein
MVVARPSRWGNPFKIGLDGDRAACVKKFADWLAQIDQANYRVAVREELRGKNLACWCAVGEPCHADILLRAANGD